MGQRVENGQLTKVLCPVGRTGRDRLRQASGTIDVREKPSSLLPSSGFLHGRCLEYRGEIFGTVHDSHTRCTRTFGYEADRARSLIANQGSVLVLHVRQHAPSKAECRPICGAEYSDNARISEVAIHHGSNTRNVLLYFEEIIE